MSRLVFRWEGFRFLYDAALGLILWGFWNSNEPRLWRGASAVVLSLSAIILNITFTFGPTLACHFESSRWFGRWAPAILAGGGVLLALATIASVLVG